MVRRWQMKGSAKGPHPAEARPEHRDHRCRQLGIAAGGASLDAGLLARAGHALTPVYSDWAALNLAGTCEADFVTATNGGSPERVLARSTTSIG
ncbi:hypothetical protein [Pseudoclavibacter sp. VKM Ac-2867]|uniref:hypothetical protein n=1 Tax=Pseudoclavibacter sp. VKM Ac-2867 TaxID=2783829 RepID=UPI00188C8CD6|nr:hypothetical protein [Pseudoclavibacter sp. VKM Ac-2867]MBF4459516.1 hypothetical protein [Pseudoclavibacter sp. VKM Ac-2867]